MKGRYNSIQDEMKAWVAGLGAELKFVQEELRCSSAVCIRSRVYQSLQIAWRADFFSPSSFASKPQKNVDCFPQDLKFLFWLQQIRFHEYRGIVKNILFL